MTTDDNNNNKNKQTRREMLASGTSIDDRYRAKSVERNQKRRTSKTLDQTTAGLELIAYNVEPVEAAIKKQLIMRLNSGGGAKPIWQDWLGKVDLNWSPKPENFTGKGEPIYNHPDDMNLFNVADMALRIVFECESTQKTLTQTCIALGKGFSNLCFREAVLETEAGDKLVKGLGRKAQLSSNDPMTRRERVNFIARKSGYLEEEWNLDDHLKEGEVFRCGTMLWNAVLMGAKIFHAEMDTLKDSDYDSYFVKFNAETQQKLDERNAELDAIPTYFGPTDYPPIAWSKHSYGPYHDLELSRGSPIVRNASPEQRDLIELMIRNGDFDLPMEALNLLQAVPLRINKYVLEALKWTRLRKYRTRAVKKYPNCIETDTRYTAEEVAAMTKRQRISVSEEERKRHADNMAAKGNRRQIKGWIDTAEWWGDDQFWLAYNFDTRGRVYHIGEFGHHNTDCLRAMFEFANKKPIGDNIDFLFLAIANTYGMDKMAIPDRVNWAKANEKIIRATGHQGGTDKNPVYGFRDEKTEYEYFMPEEVDGQLQFVSAGKMTPFQFWAKAGFQFLAACRELAKLRDWQKKTGYDESQFYSGLPVALDATQSGIQHYALASRNYNDGFLTNIVPQDKPNDLYQVVLERAKVLFQELSDRNKASLQQNPITPEQQAQIDAFEQLEDDETVGYEELKAARKRFKATGAYAKQRMIKEIDAIERLFKWGGYDRTVTKRNTMCFAYSSEEYGMSDQILTDTMNPLALQVRLKEIPEHPFGPDMGFAASVVMGRIHYQAIRDVVQSAAAGMDYFQSCSDLLHQFNLHFGFKTKWGFPVMHYYREEYENKYRPSTWLYDFKLAEVLKKDNPNFDETDAIVRRSQSLSLTRYTDKVERNGSRQAIAPNIIHSQDSLLLQMTVATCAENNVRDLLVVHDSFASTIADAQTMSECVRLATVDLYHEFDLFNEIDEATIGKVEQWVADATPEQVHQQGKKLYYYLLDKAEKMPNFQRNAAAAAEDLENAGIQLDVVIDVHVDGLEDTDETGDVGEISPELLIDLAVLCLADRPDPEQGKLHVPDVLKSAYYVS